MVAGVGENQFSSGMGVLSNQLPMSQSMIPHSYQDAKAHAGKENGGNYKEGLGIVFDQNI